MITVQLTLSIPPSAVDRSGELVNGSWGFSSVLTHQSDARELPGAPYLVSLIAGFGLLDFHFVLLEQIFVSRICVCSLTERRLDLDILA